MINPNYKFAVIGWSADPEKYGPIVYDDLKRPVKNYFLK